MVETEFTKSTVYLCSREQLRTKTTNFTYSENTSRVK